MKSIIRTEACDVLGIVHPIILAPMAGVAGGKLAAAVSNAGGLGMIAIGYSAEKAINEYKVARSLTNKPLGVGFISWKMKDCMEIFEKFLNDFKPEIFWFSFGDCSYYISRVKETLPDSKIILQIQQVGEASQAVEWGADIIVFQGSESGGHGAAIGNGSIFSTLPEVVDEIGDRVPVLAAGGVTDGRQLAAALNLGASGVVMGTRFVACVESDAPLAHKKALVEARDGGVSTTRSSLFDRLRGLDWPTQWTIRTIRNDALAEAEIKGVDVVVEKIRKSEKSPQFFAAGQGVGGIHAIWKAELIIQRTIEQCLDCFRISSGVWDKNLSKL